MVRNKFIKETILNTLDIHWISVNTLYITSGENEIKFTRDVYTGEMILYIKRHGKTEKKKKSFLSVNSISQFYHQLM